MPLDHLVGAQVDREERVQQGERAAREHGDGEAPDPRPEQVGAVDPEERAHQHHPLEADVDDAAALGHHAPERREEQRVANRSIEAISADHVNTSRRLPWPELVAARRRRSPSAPSTIAPKPSLRSL